MDTTANKASFKSDFTQIAWLVKDVETGKTFFKPKIVFFDAQKEIGVFTEIRGIGEKAVEKMKVGAVSNNAE